jgi:hypothetical protein
MISKIDRHFINYNYYQRNNIKEQMKALYEDELKDLQNKKDLTIICEGKKEFKCSETILKNCSEYFEGHKEHFPEEPLDFSKGNLIIELRVVRDSISIIQDLTHIDLLMNISHENLVKIMLFYNILLVKDSVVNKITLKLKKRGYTPTDKDLTSDVLCKTWDVALVKSKLAKFVRGQILFFLIKDNTGKKKCILEYLLKNHIETNERFKEEYEMVTYLV